MLRANLVDEAQKTIALFTKDGDQKSNLFDMQCMWYELEIGQAYCRLARTDASHYGRALKQFTSVDKHFTDIIEDQFDFHTYCIRKMTLRAYVNMLRMEDTVHGHAYYVRAAMGAIEVYIALVDKPKQDAAAAAAADESQMSAGERKKLESKKRKAEAKAKAEAEEAKAKAAVAAKAEKGAKGNFCHVDCSNRGVCDFSTGVCKCFPGSHGANCGVVSRTGVYADAQSAPPEDFLPPLNKANGNQTDVSATQQIDLGPGGGAVSGDAYY